MGPLVAAFPKLRDTWAARPLLHPTCSELLQQANRNARRVNAFRAKMQSVERWMQSQGLPTRLRRRIKTFYAEVCVCGKG
jgi:hypothetical protein